MDISLFLLVISLASPFPSFAEPSGKLGCHFSPVCDQDEVCAEDKLFGTCMKQPVDSLPSYDLDSKGLKQLKDGVQYLLDRGFAWEDRFAQDSLREILQPFKQDNALVDREPVGIWQEPLLLNEDGGEEEEEEEEEEAWANVDRLSATYQGILDEYQDRYAAYRELVDQYNLGEDPQLGQYAQAMRRRYLALIRELETEERDNLRRLYNLYYQKYLDLLQQQAGDQPNVLTGLQGGPSDGYEGGSDWKAMYKLQLLKEYLQLMYNENRDRWVTSPSSAAYSASQAEDLAPLDPSWYPLESFLEEWNGDFADEVPADDDAVAMVPEAKEPQPPNQEADDFLDVILNEEIKDYWNLLTDKEKDAIISSYLGTDDAPDGSDEAETGGVEEEEDEEEDEDEGAGAAEEPKGDGPDAGVAETPDRRESQIKGEGVGDPGQEFVEPLKQPKESGVNLAVDMDLEKKDEDGVAMVTPVPMDNEEPKATPTVDQQTTFAPTGYVFIALQSGVSQEKAERLVEELSIALDAPEGSFTDIKASEKTVTFKVHPEVIRMTPAKVAKAAASHQTDLEVLMDVTITETGQGGQTPISVLEAPRDDNSTLIIVTVVLVACIVGILIAVLTVYCYRQKARVRAKLKGLASNGGAVEGEATADYQDLCRQRMASKSSEKPEPLSRISSVAMSEGAAPSPSSRSSTSSWSEEPVQSNMDISTGHIVLSYMEDHLRNKDRISKEWEALCRYEPDISVASVGALTANTPKNRYQDVVPYDHTRVLLNASTNAQNSNYINASTIADADPRNPAYIATQAPLPSTVADFWQMVWEQGAVVIVNLTPMTDTDSVHTLYWPPEGGTCYHFYEVHLVSEHVWCDDYLVRSFYLKNTETQETRTVTQFHFLTWPENGIPPSPKALLEFRRKVNKSYRGKACPIVVHCSDGVGRTGTYCLVDMVLTRMTKGAKEIDIAATLEHIRDQRPGAVKLKEQFEFALTALAEEVNAILKALPQ